MSESERENDKSRGYGGTPRQGQKRAQGWKKAQEPTGRQAAAYVRLCQNPAKDLLSWLDVKPKPTNKAKIHQGQGANNEQFSTNRAARQYVGLCKNPLQNLRGWVGKDRPRGGGSHSMPSRPRTSKSGANGLQSVRVAGAGHLHGFKTAARATTGRANLKKVFRQAAKHKTSRGAKFGGSSGGSGGVVAEALTLSPETDQGFIAAAYEGALHSFNGAIEAAQADQTKTPAERAAIVRALRAQQQASASAARRAAAEMEKARVKATRERQKPAAKPKGHNLA